MAYGLTWLPFVNGLINPYYGGFGYFKTPAAGAGLAYAGFNYPVPMGPIYYVQGL